MIKDIGLRFNRRYPSQNQENKSEYVRLAVWVLAETILKYCPEGREQSLAMTKLEEVLFWTDAGIIRED